MFGRRKSDDGFEWHKYVRTQVRQRREQRRQRIREARHAAAQQAGAAGVALVAGSKAAGSAAWDGARAGLGAAGLGAQGLWHLLVVVAISVARGIAIACAVRGDKIALAASPLIRLLERPNVGGPVALVCAIALGLGMGRARGTGLDTEAMLTIGLGIVLLVASLPLLSSVTGLRVPSLGISPGMAVGAVAAVALAAGGTWFATKSKTRLAAVTSHLPLVGGAKPLEGRARAVGGDQLRIGDTTVRLAGVEAPLPQARCGGNRRCGTAAETALGRLVNGRNVTCKLSGTDSTGRQLATCLRGDADIGAELVRKGHVFAESGLFSSYAGLEREARNAKAGIWSNGEPERPADYRARAGGKRNS